MVGPCFYAIQVAYDALGRGIIKNALPQHTHSMLKTDMQPTATVLFYGGHCRHRMGRLQRSSGYTSGLYVWSIFHLDWHISSLIYEESINRNIWPIYLPGV